MQVILRPAIQPGVIRFQQPIRLLKLNWRVCMLGHKLYKPQVAAHGFASRQASSKNMKQLSEPVFPLISEKDYYCNNKPSVG